MSSMRFHVSRRTFLKSRFGEVGHCGGACSVSFLLGSRAQRPSMPVGFFLSWYPGAFLSCLLLSTSSSFPLCSSFCSPEMQCAPGLKTSTFTGILLRPTGSLPNLYLAGGAVLAYPSCTTSVSCSCSCQALVPLPLFTFFTVQK